MYQEEPREQFDLTQKDFTLCSFDMKPKDTSYILAVNIIDSYSKSIKITQIIDCNFFTSFESLLKQIIPPHEDTNFYILANCPDSQSFEKVKNITTSMGVFTKSVIKLEDQNFKEKISDDIFYNIKLLFPDENINNYQT